MMLELVSVLVVVGGAASSTVAVPDSACQAKLNAWCNRPSSCPIAGRKEGNHKCEPPFFALNSSGDPTRPSQREVQWRCFAGSDLDASHTHYDGSGSCYCSHDEQLRYELCLCQHNGDQSQCPAPPAPPAPKPSPPPPKPLPWPPQPPPAVPKLSFVDVIVANDTIRSCYRNPVMVETTTGDLLCFIEERSRGPDWHPNHNGDHSCGDNYKGGAGGHNLGYMRSSNMGKSWSPIVRVAGNLSNLMAVGATDFTNNALIPMVMPDGTEQLLYQYGTQNNPSFTAHGRILQRVSKDAGHTWSEPVDVSSAGTSVGFPGATPGPAIGVQVNKSGTLAFCSWGNRYNGTFGEKGAGWGHAANFGNFLTFSTDWGRTWSATAPIAGEGWNECFITQLSDDKQTGLPRVLEISRRTLPDATVKVQYPPHTYAMVTFTGHTFEHRSATATLPDVATPVCEGSLIAHEGALYFSHPESTSGRTHLTIHKSEDEGKSWPKSVLVWQEGSGSGYSSLTATSKGLAIAFNQWPMDDKKSDQDGPGQKIVFTIVPYSSFA